MIMCKINDNKESLIRYIETVLDYRMTVGIMNQNKVGMLPMFIAENYQILQTQILDHEVCLLCSKGSNSFTPAKLYKQMLLVQAKLDMVVVFVMECVESYNLQRLIAQRVNFIIPGKQMFMPSLLLDIKKVPKTVVNEDRNIPAFSQFLILYHLQKEKLDGLTTREVADKFSISYTHTNRAIRWLVEKALITLEGGKEKTMFFSASGKVLFERAHAFLISPVEQVLFTDDTSDCESVCHSGVNALSAYTMLNDEERRYFAFSRNRFKEAGIHADKQYGTNVIEIWRYDPLPLSLDGNVDKLSLYLSMRDDQDERIQIELEQLIGTMIW